MPTATREVVVLNSVGLHARPAMAFVDAANTFRSNVTVEKTGEDAMTVDGKSIMAMITLAAMPGTQLLIHADGEDAAAAVDQLAALFASKFGEE